MRLRHILSLGAVTASLIAPSIASAAEIAPYRSARLQAMGGAATATPMGGDTMWQNPAALGIRPFGLDLDLVNPQVGATHAIREITGDGQNTEDIEALLNELLNMKQPAGGSVSLFPSMVFRGFGAGLLIGVAPEAYLDASESLSFDIATAVSAGGIVSIGHGFWADRIGVGASFKGIKKVQALGSMSQTEEGFDMGEPTVTEGMVGGLDVGVVGQIPGYGMWNPTVGLMVKNAMVMALPDPVSLGQNVGSMTGGGDSSSSSEEETTLAIQQLDLGQIKPEINVGASVSPALLAFMRGQMTFDYVDITGSGELLDHVHIGAEIDTLNLIAARVGLAYGQPTFGLGFDLPLIRIDAATYVERSVIGDIVGRHYSAQVSVGF